MTEHSGPWSTGPGITVDQWSQYFGALLGFGSSTNGAFGVCGDPSSSDLKAFGDATGLQVKLPVGMAIVDGQWYFNDAVQTIAIGPNSSGSTRIDRLVIRRIEGSSTSTATIIPGTPGGTPAPPAITNQDLQIAQIVVANGAVTINAANVADERWFVPRGVQPVTATNPLPASPFVGQCVGLAGTGLLFWDGTEWEQVQYDSGWIAFDTNRAGGHGWIPSPTWPTYIRRYGETVRIKGLAQQGSSAPALIAAAGTIPVNMRPAGQMSYQAMSTNGVAVTVFIEADGSITLGGGASPFATGVVAVGDFLTLDGSWLVN